MSTIGTFTCSFSAGAMPQIIARLWIALWTVCVCIPGTEFLKTPLPWLLCRPLIANPGYALQITTAPVSQQAEVGPTGVFEVNSFKLTNVKSNWNHFNNPHLCLAFNRNNAWYERYRSRMKKDTPNSRARRRVYNFKDASRLHHATFPMPYQWKVRNFSLWSDVRTYLVFQHI